MGARRFEYHVAGCPCDCVNDTPPIPSDASRYQKQVRLAEVGEAGQRALAESHAIVVGVGALGCAVADQLARAGVGRLTLVDRDIVEWSNLQRQCLYTEQDAREGVPKAEAARRRLLAVNSAVRIEAVVADVTARNAERVVFANGAATERFILVDGTDNFEVRFLLNDLAVKHDVPLAYAGVVGVSGTSMTIIPRRTACLRCLGDKPAPGSVETCDTAGVFGPAVAAIAAFQAAEVLRILARGVGINQATLVGLDVWRRTTRVMDTAGLGPRPDCVCCGQRRFEHLDSKRAAEEVALCGQDAVQVSPGEDRRIELGALASKWTGLGTVTVNALLARLIFASESRAKEVTVFADGRAIIKGTAKPEVARAIYARYVGV